MKSISTIFSIFLRMCTNVSSVSSVELGNLSKEDLIYRIRQLETQVTVLKNTIAKRSGEKEKKQKPFDFTRYKKRHVLLKFLYLGWDYNGFAGQEEGINTIESELFKTLQTTKLIESIKTANYNRCGRTDSGVSAFSQVISVDLRSNLLEGEGVFTPSDYNPVNRANYAKEELPYCKMLNKNLPKNIKIIAWAPINCNINARFDCSSRTYKYYFIKGNLDIKAMEEASKYFIGEHDFRNICKMNIKNFITNYKRTILDVSISPIGSSSEGSYQVYELIVKGYAFLWHQIRYMAAVLFLVGQGKEAPQVVKELLDVEKYPRKPQYAMAIDIPLVFFDCEFGDVNWQYDKENIEKIIFRLQKFWTEHKIKSTIVKRMIESLESKLNMHVEFNTGSLISGTSSRTYTPLLKRNFEETLEEKLEKMNKKKKIREALQGT
ncbi:tRNA pseudouridine(38/39) synthase [Centruroides vittatus]|uniref:tRNA pseudouridine(38/39) synthase n=1 Tax=Centruroides vittatus TaxID=120091 RepID=UPI003510CD8C